MPSKTAPDRVRRYDVASSASRTKRLENGWLRAEGIVARTGVQEYRRADGTVLRELRLPAEVFRPEALDGLAMAPVTDEHPPTMLDSSNTGLYARGHLGERIESVDGRLVKASLLITDAALVEKILSGRQAELSVGYLCDLEQSPGVWNGEPYDCVQRRITPNHVAITARARGGPELRVRLDSTDAVSLTDPAAYRLIVLENLWRAPTVGACRQPSGLVSVVTAVADADTSRARNHLELEQLWRRPLAGTHRE